MSFFLVSTVFFSGQFSLSHTHIDPWGFSFTFPTSISVTFIWEFPPGKFPVEKVGVVSAASTFLLNYQNVQEIKIGLAENKIRKLQLLS